MGCGGCEESAQQSRPLCQVLLPGQSHHGFASCLRQGLALGFIEIERFLNASGQLLRLLRMVEHEAEEQHVPRGVGLQLATEQFADVRTVVCRFEKLRLDGRREDVKTLAIGAVDPCIWAATRAELVTNRFVSRPV